MKIAIPIKEKTLSSKVDARFARAAFFTIYDTESKEAKFLENVVLQAHGAGPKMVETLANEKVDALISNSIGPNAFTALKQANIKVYLAKEGSAEENIKRVIEGTATMLDTPGSSHR